MTPLVFLFFIYIKEQKNERLWLATTELLIDLFKLSLAHVRTLNPGRTINAAVLARLLLGCRWSPVKRATRFLSGFGCKHISQAHQPMLGLFTCTLTELSHELFGFVHTVSCNHLLMPCIVQRSPRARWKNIYTLSASEIHCNLHPSGIVLQAKACIGEQVEIRVLLDRPRFYSAMQTQIHRSCEAKATAKRGLVYGFLITAQRELFTRPDKQITLGTSTVVLK